MGKVKLIEKDGHQYWEAEDTDNWYTLRKYPTMEQAQAAEDSNINCYDCVDCHACMNCNMCIECADCTSCCFCSHCSGCEKCSGCIYCVKATNSRSSALLMGIDECIKCFPTGNTFKVLDILEQKNLISVTKEKALTDILDKASDIIEDYKDKFTEARRLLGSVEPIVLEEE